VGEKVQLQTSGVTRPRGRTSAAGICDQDTRFGGSASSEIFFPATRCISGIRERSHSTLWCAAARARRSASAFSAYFCASLNRFCPPMRIRAPMPPQRFSRVPTEFQTWRGAHDDLSPHFLQKKKEKKEHRGSSSLAMYYLVSVGHTIVFWAACPLRVNQKSPRTMVRHTQRPIFYQSAADTILPYHDQKNYSGGGSAGLGSPGRCCSPESRLGRNPATNRCYT